MWQTLDALDGNGQNFSVNEVVTGDTSGVRGTVVSWDLSNKVLIDMSADRGAYVCQSQSLNLSSMRFIRFISRAI